MIYTEKITTDIKDFSIERQKDSPNGKWYGIWLASKGLSLADSDEWITETLPNLTDEELKSVFKEESKIKLSDDDIRLVRKVVRKAKKLGWFDEIK